MLSVSVQRTLKRFGIALAIPFSLFLTLTALLDLPAVQARHHTAVMPLASSDSPSQPILPRSPGDPAASSDSVNVNIVDFAFHPSVITITAGTTVVWTNLDGTNHTATSDVGSSDPWDSGSLGHNEIFTKTFNIPGIYNYHCNIHSSMHGSVVVLAPQSPTEVNVTGPSGGAANIVYAFTALVSPITTTQPITYLWQATGQTPVTHTTQGLSDTLAFTWPVPDVGPQLITVTAENSVGSVSTTHTINLVPPSNVYLPLVLR